MTITRKHPVAGKPLLKGSFNLHSDKGGNFGILIGYVPEGAFTGDKILLTMQDAEDFARHLHCGLKNFYERFEPKEKFKEKIRRWLLGILGGSAVDNPN